MAWPTAGLTQGHLSGLARSLIGSPRRSCTCDRIPVLPRIFLRSGKWRKPWRQKPPCWSPGGNACLSSPHGPSIYTPPPPPRCRAMTRRSKLCPRPSSCALSPRPGPPDLSQSAREDPSLIPDLGFGGLLGLVPAAAVNLLVMTPLSLTRISSGPPPS